MKRFLRMGGFSFLELIIVSFLFSVGMVALFPVFKGVKLGQQDLILRFKALKIAENVMILTLENPSATELPIILGREKFSIRKKIVEKNRLSQLQIEVVYASGTISGAVSLATLIPQK